jgi:DNA-directed RNA polymerase specialized sigma24 family protein
MYQDFRSYFPLGTEAAFYPVNILSTRETTQMKATRKRPSQEDKIDYEAEMDKVTIPASPKEIQVSPHILEEILEGYTDDYAQYLETSPEMVMEKWDQLERLRLIAARKLQGQLREIMLILLNTGFSGRRISDILHVSRNRVQPQIEQALETLRQHIRPRKEIHFPDVEGRSFQTAILSVDTDDEQKRFQEFINGERTIHALAYGGNGDFREVLVIYSEPLAPGALS